MSTIVIGHEVIKQTDSNGNHGNHNSIGFADEWTPEIPFENVSLLGKCLVLFKYYTNF